MKKSLEGFGAGPDHEPINTFGGIETVQRYHASLRMAPQKRKETKIVNQVARHAYR